MDQMDVQQASDLAIEIHLAALDAWPEKCTRTDIQNLSGQAQAV